MNLIGKAKTRLWVKPKRMVKDCTILSFVVFRCVLSMFLLLIGMAVWAQDGNAGIQEATNKVKSYFDTGCDLMYAIGAVVGIIGAVKVFNKWNAGEPDTNKVAAAWFGSCIFLVVVATVLKSFFGI
jgi:hypothetical protein